MNGTNGRQGGSGGQERAPDNSDPTGIGPPPPGSTTEVTGEGKGVTHGSAVKLEDDQPSPDTLAE